MNRALHRPAAWLLGTFLLGGLSHASLADEAYPDAQLAVMAGGCANCHGTDGRLSGTVPPIAGRPAEELESSLLAFKRDEADGTTIMPRIAKGFSDEELAALAQHFAAIDEQ